MKDKVEAAKNILEEIRKSKNHTGVISCPTDYNFYIEPYQRAIDQAIELLEVPADAEEEQTYETETFGLYGELLPQSEADPFDSDIVAVLGKMVDIVHDGTKDATETISALLRITPRAKWILSQPQPDSKATPSDMPERFTLPDDAMLSKQAAMEERMGISLDRAANTWAWNEWNNRAHHFGRNGEEDYAIKTAISLAEDLYRVLRQRQALAQPAEELKVTLS